MSIVIAALALAAASADNNWRKPSGKGFEGLAAEVRHIVNTSPRSRARRNHLCAVVEIDRGAGGSVEETGWLHWREGRYIYQLGPAANPPLGDENIWTAGSIDLVRDVVAREQDIAGSTYRVTRNVPDRIINACALYGRQFVVEKRRAR